MIAHIGYIREKLPDRLANYSRMNTVLNSALSGFGFGAEFFLILGIWVDAPDLAIAVLFGHLLHFFGGIVLGIAFFGVAKNRHE